MEIQKKWFTETTPTNANKASTTIGAGTDGVVTVEYDVLGTEGNDYTIAVNAALTAPRDLSAVLTGTDLIIYLATEGNAKASATIGSGTDGAVEIEVDAAGTGGNAYTVEVVAGDGALSAELTDTALVVTLASGGSTATLVAGAINTSAGDTFTATATGTGGDSITLAEAEASFIGGTNQLDATANTAILVAGAINTAAGDTLTATKSGTGATAISSAVAEKNFTGGTYCTPFYGDEAWLYIGTTYYYCSKPCGALVEDAWQTVAFTTI